MKKGESTHWAVKQNDVVSAAFNSTGQTDKSSMKYISYIMELKKNINSVCDLGCGLGLWLNTAKKLGANYIRGYDIPEIEVEKRKIPKECYVAADLSKLIKIDRRFDLAISVEVAEHIDIKHADIFISNLVNLSDVVLFGAALPYQGGMGHVNENWLEYWATLFKSKGYKCYDIFREKFWHDTSIIYYYRQNTLLFVKEGQDEFLLNKEIYSVDLPKSYIHPDMYIKSINRPLPSNEKKVWEDITIYYDYVNSENAKEQEKRNRIYGDKHLGWSTQVRRFKNE